MDNVGYKQYWLQVWWQGISSLGDLPTLVRLLFSLFQSNTPSFDQTPKQIKQYMYTILPTHTHTHMCVCYIHYTQGNNYEQKSPKPHGVRVTQLLFGRHYWLGIIYRVDPDVHHCYCGCNTRPKTSLLYNICCIILRIMGPSNFLYIIK